MGIENTITEQDVELDMKKGKRNAKERKFLSIIVAPHFTGRVKTFRISALYTKLVATFIFMLISLACVVIFISHTVEENHRLRNTISELCNVNNEQMVLINDKSSEIGQLKAKEATFDSKIKEYVEKYREMTDNYISNRIDGSSASRSGDRDDRSFSADINELESILKSLSEINNTDNSLIDLSDTENKLKLYLDTIPTFWPASGKISDVFGYRKDPFTLKKAFHEGVDISAAVGTNIKAAGSGKVVFSGKKSGYGYTVVIDHGYSTRTLYGHASKLLVKVGQTVNKGDIIAKVGSTGRSTGPHLHFEVLIAGTPVDPLKYLDSE